jgi:hypothetical protein
VKIATAQLPEPERSQDRVFTTSNAAIVLDGASAFARVGLDAGSYADTLGRLIVDQLLADPEADLISVVFDAIGGVACRFDLRPGRSPSSTVSILRALGERVDLYVLGDTPIYYGDPTGCHVFVDTRLADLDLPESREYRNRLRTGTGYDGEHRALLMRLQERQRACRNTSAGYWIAEAEPHAAEQALVAEVGPEQLSWAVLATDGIANTVAWLGRHEWRDVATYSPGRLDELLDEYQHWEERTDPHGVQLPRSKRHDDKAIAAIPGVWT